MWTCMSIEPFGNTTPGLRGVRSGGRQSLVSLVMTAVLNVVPAQAGPIRRVLTIGPLRRTIQPPVVTRGADAHWVKAPSRAWCNIVFCACCVHGESAIHERQGSR